jgi:hypothetical protein
MVPCAFFPPSFYPILDRGKGDKHAVIAPEVPAGGAVGQAVFNHQAHGHLRHTMGVMTAGEGQIGQINVEMLPAVGTVVTRVGHSEVNGTTGV